VGELANLIGRPCDYDDEFLARYVVHSVLSIIEDIERDMILAMKYGDFAKVSRKEAYSRVMEYLDQLVYACIGEHLSELKGGTLIDDIMKLMSSYKVFEASLCYLYTCGVNNDEIPFIILRGVQRSKCMEEVEFKEDIEVKSRFSELALYLARLKQRFFDKTVFESKQLVSRVFAFNELRWVPVAKIEVDEIAEMLGNYVDKLYKKYCSLIGGGECGVPQELIGIVKEFVRKLSQYRGITRFYGFQDRGFRALWDSLLEALDGADVERYVTLEAPTGSGKSEVFLVTAILLALIEKFLCRNKGNCGVSPLTLIVYPRLSLARDQFDRLVTYTWILNKILEDKGWRDRVTVSIMNMEVLSFKDYDMEVRKVVESLGKGSCRSVSLGERYVKVNFDVCKDAQNDVYIEFSDKFTFFKCPDNSYPRIYIHEGSPLVRCNQEDFTFVKLFRDIVRKEPGDIHVTLFETLRLDLITSYARTLFGRSDLLGGPLLIVIDEVHTYTGITGARYAYVLRRIMNRVKHEGGGKHGFVVLGLSATIPDASESFLLDLFFLSESGKAKLTRVKPESGESIPVGSDYFYIVVPDLRELVDYVSVSVQTIMALHLNTPSPSFGSSKKTLAFSDSLEVVSRLARALRDALTRYEIGLQGLRNPFTEWFKSRTCQDYGADKVLCEKLDESMLLDNLQMIDNSIIWVDGELWWPHSLECQKYPELCRKLVDVRVYTSRYRSGLVEPGVIVTTSSLELGVDYADVAVIYQHGAPVNIAALIQRAGRGGRRVFTNPLLRTVIAIQLSPEIPQQSYMIEILLRTGSLRKALNYERLMVPTRNEILAEQTLAELTLEHYVYSSNLNSISDDKLRDFECGVVGYIQKHENELISYARGVLGKFFDDSKVKGLLNKVKQEIMKRCGDRMRM
jgi:hypothetical protein